MRREIQEEAGVDVASTSYVASQPWPFPSSLMLGFHAIASGGEPRPNDVELADVRWFEHREVEDAAADQGPVFLPPPFTIARRLIDGWLVTGGQDKASGRSG